MTDILLDESIIFLVALFLLLGTVTAKLAARIGLPTLVAFLGVGMILGSDISGLIVFDNPPLARAFGTFALVIILFEGGLHTSVDDLRRVRVPAFSLATLGVVLTAVVVGLASTWILGLSFAEGLLIGAIVGSTDAAAVFSVLRQKRIRRRLKRTLEAESGLNDPMAIFLTIAMIEIIQAGEVSWIVLLGGFLWQILLGAVAGILLGRAAIWLINSIGLGSAGLYPVLALALALTGFSVSELLGGSGFLAVYVLGLTLGGRELVYRHHIVRFHEGFAWMMQILMFTLLGLLVFPSQLVQVIVKALLVGLVLVFLARPLAVWISTAFQNFDLPQRAFLAWSGLRGAVPIVLATYPLSAGIPHSDVVFNVVFFVVLVSALLQGSTISWVANRLGLIAGDRETQPSYTLELISVGRAAADLVEVEVADESVAAGKSLQELNLPSRIAVSAVIRGSQILVPRGDTRLQGGDVVFVLAPVAEVETIKDIFRLREVPEEDEEKGEASR